MTGNRKLFSSYKAYNRGNVIFGSNLRGNIIGKGPSAIRSYEGNCYTLVIVDDYSRKVKKSLNVIFNEIPPPSKTPSLVNDELDEEEAVKVTEKKNLENDIEDETLEIDEIVNIKKSRNHPLENELVPQPRNMKIIRTKWVFRNKLDENGIVSQNYANHDLAGLYAFSDSLLLSPLCCDDIHDVTPYVFALVGCENLVSEPSYREVGSHVSPTRRKYRDSVAFATRVEEKMTLNEVDGKTVEKIETKIISKDGTVTRVPRKFQGYETFEEEPVEQPRIHDLCRFVDHPQLQQGNPLNEFAPHRLPQPEGNMNGWLMEDKEELDRNEVDLDLKSTASRKPKRVELEDTYESGSRTNPNSAEYVS
nr:integrase, catalytic region, zinc finger, CCHC-type, peptidase aspartic, catalytic [Tanacetum cinerariifolium]